MSPRLIQLGIKQDKLSMMYLLSQGKITGLSRDNTFWGYTKLASKDSGSSFCYSYEAVPSCLDLDYDPGGSISWTTTVSSSGPNGTGQFVTEDKCQKIALNWQSTITVSGSGTIVGGFGGVLGIQHSLSYGTSDCKVYGESWNYMSGSYWKPTSNFTPNSIDVYKSGRHSSQQSYPVSGCPNLTLINRFYDMSKHHRQASWNQTSEVRLTYEVFRTSDNVRVKNGTIWVKHGSTSLTIDGLAPAQYRVVFSSLYKERNKAYSTATIPNPSGSIASFWASYTASYPTSGPSSGFMRHTNPGSETQSITCAVTQTIYHQLGLSPNFLVVTSRFVGGLSDLTMIGINGDIFKLRPTGVDYFIQAHTFVTQGVQVERLLQGGTGASRYYPDLVHYLMKKSKVLQDEQIGP